MLVSDIRHNCDAMCQCYIDEKESYRKIIGFMLLVCNKRLDLYIALLHPILCKQ